MKMSTMRTKLRSGDESDSMHQLAQSDNDNETEHGDEEQGIHGAGDAWVVISGNDTAPGLQRVDSPSTVVGGILVKSETSIQVTQAR
jgi:hypothetical protein